MRSTPSGRAAGGWMWPGGCRTGHCGRRRIGVDRRRTPATMRQLDSESPGMKTKADIVQDWLPRYTGRPVEQFGRYVLLTNFTHYVELFAERFGVEILGRDRPMQSATAQNLTILNFGMGSAMAATVMDLLAAVEPKAVLFLGKCG